MKLQIIETTEYILAVSDEQINGLAVNHYRTPQEAYSAAFDYVFEQVLNKTENT